MLIAGVFRVCGKRRVWLVRLDKPFPADDTFRITDELTFIVKPQNRDTFPTTMLFAGIRNDLRLRRIGPCGTRFR